ncbi:hypothetical protein [Acinetobacter gerneri]|jgi:hypothetical protein|uniref:hypothetical protein n=1 Tax=Acinetobacter gerneri TaxID=202952 RepID=UPI0023EFC7DB|nr:hypothetical protein [Acinetobacter gerneri]MCH4243748.1 hypothetical protein [Acinetobacter gerneri]
MALPFVVDSLDAIKEEHRALYVEVDGKFRLDLDGYEDPKGLKSALQSERDAAKTAKQQLKDLQAQFEGIDPEKTRQLLEQLNKDEDAQLIAAGKVDEVIQKRTEKMRQDHEKQIAVVTEKAAKAEAYANKFKQSVIKGQIAQAFSGVGGLAEATDDVTALALSQFALDEKGNAVMIGTDGEPIIGKDGANPLSPKEWVENLKENKPYFFPRANGTNAPGSSTSVKKWSDYSELERAAIARDNPNQFQQLLKTKDN